MCKNSYQPFYKFSVSCFFLALLNLTYLALLRYHTDKNNILLF